MFNDWTFFNKVFRFGFFYISKQAGSNVILLFEMEVVLYLKIMMSLMGCFLPACKRSTSFNNYKQLWKIGHIRRHDIDIMRGVKYYSILNGVPLYRHKQTYGNFLRNKRVLLNAIFQLYHGKNKLHLIRWWYCLLYTIPTCLVGFL